MLIQKPMRHCSSRETASANAGKSFTGTGMHGKFAARTLLEDGKPEPAGMAFPAYSRTNENLSAIVSGMEIKPGDRVLAACGAGDVVFAALSVTPNVKGVDISPWQVAFTSGRARMLTEGDYHHFFGLDDLGNGFDRPLNEKNIRYLLGIGDDTHLENINFESQHAPRLKSIRANAPGLYLEAGDLYDVLHREADRYNRIYLSNILTLVKKEKMEQIVESLPLGAVIYASGNFRPLLAAADYKEEFCERVPLDSRLTSIARASERDFWEPEVYVKVR